MGFLSDVLSSATLGATDLLGITDSDFPTLGNYLKRGKKGNLFDVIPYLADPTGVVRGGTRQAGYYLPHELGRIAQSVAPLVGGVLYGPGGAAAGAQIGSYWNEGATGQSANQQQATVNAGLAALMAYLGGKAMKSGGAKPTAAPVDYSAYSQPAQISSYNTVPQFQVDYSLGGTPPPNTPTYFSPGSFSANPNLELGAKQGLTAKQKFDIARITGKAAQAATQTMSGQLALPPYTPVTALNYSYKPNYYDTTPEYLKTKKDETREEEKKKEKKAKTRMLPYNIIPNRSEAWKQFIDPGLAAFLS